MGIDTSRFLWNVFHRFHAGHCRGYRCLLGLRYVKTVYSIKFSLKLSNVNATCSRIGVDRICLDIEFMMNRKTGLYWRLCWNLLMPLLLISILLYTFITYEQLKYDDKAFPSWAYGNLFKIQLGCQHIGDVCEQQQ